MELSLKEKAHNIKLENIPFTLNIKEFYKFIKRLTNQAYVDKFEIKHVISLDGYDYYKLYDLNDKIVIEATSGSAAGVAFNYYLNKICHYYIGFLNTNGTLPSNPPKVNDIIENHSIFDYRYFLNYCTFGYSFAYYTWKDYEKVIDRIILSGYNLVLNPLGQETIWKEVLLKLGYTKKEALDFLVDITFMPWFNMMNITSYLASYDDSKYKRRIDLANKFSKRLLDFGISPLLPGYAGMIPNDFKKHYKDADIIDQGLWCGYERQDYLRYTDPLFKKIANIFYQTQNDLLGHNKSHYYSIDPFHEGGITDGINLTKYSKYIFEIMKENDSKSVWSLQGWDGNPKKEIIEAIPPEKILICNLLSDDNIQEDFSHRPWIYCSVNNFGGNHILRCGINKQLHKPYEIKKDNNYTLVGIGLMPEAIETDDIIFDIEAAMAINSKPINTDNFIKDSILLRYGKTSNSLKKAWQILESKIYVDDITSHEFESGYLKCPTNEASKTSFHAKAPFGKYPEDTIKVASLLLENYNLVKDSKAYIFDLIDITRQASADFSWHLIYKMEDEYNNKNLKEFIKTSNLFIKLMKLQDKLCSCHERFLLSNMLKYPKKYGLTKEEKDHYIYATKRILTVWGDDRCKLILNDYTNREYGGFIKSYYLPRYELFIKARIESLTNNSPIQEIDWYKYGDDWCKTPLKVSSKVLLNPDKYAKEILDILINNKF